MAGKTIGIEIGSDTLKLVETGGGTVRRSVCVRLPENMVVEGKITSMEAMTNFIKDVRKEYKIGGGNAALVLPYHSVITNAVTMPPMSDQELVLNLPFEFRDFVGQDGAKYLYDYAVMESVKGDSGEIEKLELFSSAVKKDLILSFDSMLKKAGLTLKVAIPHEMAWLNLVRQATNEPKELCIIDIGHTVTRIYLYADNKFIMGREIEMGGMLLDATIADQLKQDTHTARTYKEANMNNVLSDPECNEVYNSLAVEIIKVINFYNNFSNRNGNLQDIYFCGGVSAIEQLRTVLLKNLNLTMHHICRLVPGGVEEQETLCCAVAAGAAIQ